MAHELNLQVLAGDYVKTALIAEWKVKVGDEVKKGDILLTTETAKVTVEIESPWDGVVEQILVPAGEDVDISATIAVIGDGAGLGAQAAEAPPAAQAPAAPLSPAPATARADRVFFTPVARRMARDNRLDLEALAGECGKARITKQDVLARLEQDKSTVSATSPATASSDEPQRIPVKGRRLAIAQRMHRSTSTKPRVTHFIEADMTDLLRAKAYLGGKYPGRGITITGLVAVAVTRALREHPYMNATYQDETMYLYPNINLGIAVDLDEGLMVPVIRHCEAMDGVVLCEALTGTANACKAGTLLPGDYMGGTFTITNLGTTGVGHFTPIINEPEVGILAMGSAKTVLGLQNGAVVERKELPLSLSFDHRAVDGAPAARFLATVKEYLENLFLLGF